jgi:hypothetical protein
MRPLDVQRIAWTSSLPVIGAALAAAYAYKITASHSVPPPELPALVEIPRKEFSPDERRAIQETFWSRIQGEDRRCARSFVFAYMDALERRCEIEDGAEDIMGGCAHMTDPFNYPWVLQAGLERCGIDYSTGAARHCTRGPARSPRTAC